MPTIFTKIINGEIPCHTVWEDDRFFAFLDIRPIQPGMTLVVPKKEAENPFDMTDDEYCDLLRAAKRLVPAIQAATGSLRVGLIIEGLEVPHAHVKLVPISKPADLAQSNARAATEKELVAMAEKIKANLK
ncbi:MAG TPA: HIT family protein [Candidatus Methylomirabilis sp.]|nr:HIT family protein [Candidatus Methylomirabilis sp.]